MAATASVGFSLPGKPLGIATAQASTLIGLDAHPISVEACSTRGPSFFQMVGLAEAAVREARVRVATSLARLGVLIDEQAITINLAPADLRKSGASLDLAIAAALLGALGLVPSAALEGLLVLGELGLDGSIHAVRGVLPQLDGARARGVRRAIVPADNAREAGLVNDITVFVASSLEDVRAYLAGERRLPTAPRTEFEPSESASPFDLCDVLGQADARRALEIAAAGSHNLLLIGPPGSGKTMLARLLSTILPPLTFEEAIQATAIHSVAGLVDPDAGVITQRPYRAPHHSVSDAGLVGGGNVPRPGEVSLAHHGVLFLDELAEFRRSALEALRQPLEDGVVFISRARARAWFPARPMLVAAVNPCACGYRGHPTRACRCPPGRGERYLSRLSGPLLDRLDLHVSVPAVDVSRLVSRKKGESSAVVRARVAAARATQARRRQSGLTTSPLNSELTAGELDRIAPFGKGARALFRKAAEKYGLSARAFVRVRRVARTIADLEGAEEVRTCHLDEAVQGHVLESDPFA